MRPLWPQLVAKGARLDVVAPIVNYSKLELAGGEILAVEPYGIFTFAHFAAKYNDSDLLKAVIAGCIDLDVCSSRFGSALHVACDNGNVEVARLLLKNGAHSDSVAMDWTLGVVTLSTLHISLFCTVVVPSVLSCRCG